MNKKTLTLTLGSTLATVLTASSAAYADGNPFALKEMSGATMVAQAGQATETDKAKEGKCGEGKCGASKAKAAANADKSAEGKCGAEKMPTDKMKEGQCGGDKKK